MSSLRNAVKRITHKERAQPQARAKLGLLEKKKDYKQRAQDYHRKEDRINAMRQKAAMRNPDEFYFGMHNSQVTDGHHRKTQEAKQREFDEQVGLETVRIMKDQDLSYVRMQKQHDIKKVERLRSSLHSLEEGPNTKRKHTVYVDSKEEAEQFDTAKHFDTIPEFAGRAFNRPRKEALKETALKVSGYGQEFQDEVYRPTEQELAKQAKQARRLARKLAKAKFSAYSEMEARTKRAEAMERAEEHLVTEKLVAAKGRKRKIKAAENGKPAQYKWRRKRQG